MSTPAIEFRHRFFVLRQPPACGGLRLPHPIPPGLHPVGFTVREGVILERRRLSIDVNAWAVLLGPSDHLDGQLEIIRACARGGALARPPTLRRRAVRSQESGVRNPESGIRSQTGWNCASTRLTWCWYGALWLFNVWILVFCEVDDLYVPDFPGLVAGDESPVRQPLQGCFGQVERAAGIDFQVDLRRPVFKPSGPIRQAP